eukprot:TRINITY_DN36072_c0_g1_i2.p1 TRINITY_DN36072_c0_g1~~TRINITY_DN36072_c0_g1_i2.p1  ORF type:complete len:207 (-),score=10.33 TRINITY_DN36072_c0_g1_i2:333-884(-)
MHTFAGGNVVALPFVLLLVATASGSGSRHSWSPPEKMALYMRRCVQLARDAEAAGGGPYGAVIVDPASGRVLEGRNHASRDPIWHGEMAAIQNLSQHLLPGQSVYEVAPNLELYTSAEPCPMCSSALAFSRFGRVVYGTSIPFISEHGGDQIHIRTREVFARSPTSMRPLLVEGFLRNETDVL